MLIIRNAVQCNKIRTTDFTEKVRTTRNHWVSGTQKFRPPWIFNFDSRSTTDRPLVCRLHLYDSWCGAWIR